MTTIVMTKLDHHVVRLGRQVRAPTVPARDRSSCSRRPLAIFEAVHLRRKVGAEPAPISGVIGLRRVADQVDANRRSWLSHSRRLRVEPAVRVALRISGQRAA